MHYPREKTIQRFMDQVRRLTKRRVPPTTKELIEELNPICRGGASTTIEPTSESSSIDSTVGLCAESGRIPSAVGGTAPGKSCRCPFCTERYGLVLGSIDTIFGSWLERLFLKAGRGKTAHTP